MYQFWILWGIDALVALTLIYFFLIGLGDGTVSSESIGLWLIILISMIAVLLSGYWLFAHQYSVIAKLLLSLVTISSVLYGLFMLLMLLGSNSSGWK